VTRKEYHRVYNLARYYRLLSKALDLLGNVCNNCGSKENLQFDHIKRATKTFDITTKIMSFAWKKVQAEIEKCQLLCVTCHQEKSCDDLGKTMVKGKDIHGTLSSYRYCKCSECVKVHTDYCRQYRIDKRAGIR